VRHAAADVDTTQSTWLGMGPVAVSPGCLKRLRSSVTLNFIGLLATLGAGFGLGRGTFKVHVRRAFLTAFVAAGVQAGLKVALPHAAIDEIAPADAYTATGQLRLTGLAMIETAGLLLPVAFMPWTSPSSRALATWYVLGAAFLAVATHYVPFDVVIMNGEVIGPKHHRTSSFSCSPCRSARSVIWPDGSGGTERPGGPALESACRRRNDWRTSGSLA
jgi:hypothetical protein